MTIVYDPARASSLVTSGEENNPVILWDDRIATITAPDGVEANGAAANSLTGDTFDFARPSVVAGTAILEFTASASLSAVAIAAHDLADLGATARLEYSDSKGSTWTAVDAGPITPTENRAVMWRIVSQSHGDWRVRFTGISGGTPNIGVLMAGAETILPQRIYQGYAPPITPTRVNLTPRISEGGHFLGSTVVSRGSEATAQLSDIPDDFVRGAAWKGFQRHFNDGRAFFWAWRPAKYGDLFFAKSSGNPIVATNSGPRARMSFDLPMVFYHDG